MNQYHKQLIECNCGVILNRGGLLQHKKTKKHKQFEEVYEFIYS